MVVLVAQVATLIVVVGVVAEAVSIVIAVTKVVVWLPHGFKLDYPIFRHAVWVLIDLMGYFQIISRFAQ